jgi:hypothetical protein
MGFSFMCGWVPISASAPCPRPAREIQSVRSGLTFVLSCRKVAPEVHRGFRQCFVVWLLAVAIGGHWPLLQSIAWVNMIVSYSQRDGFATAVQKTFNGKNPCRICHFVREAKEAEQKQPIVVAVAKVEFFLIEQEMFFLAAPAPSVTEFNAPAFLSRAGVPLLPPPKTA